MPRRADQSPAVLQCLPGIAILEARVQPQMCLKLTHKKNELKNPIANIIFPPKNVIYCIFTCNNTVY